MPFLPRSLQSGGRLLDRGCSPPFFPANHEQCTSLSSVRSLSASDSPNRDCRQLWLSANSCKIHVHIKLGEHPFNDKTRISLGTLHVNHSTVNRNSCVCFRTA